MSHSDDFNFIYFNGHLLIGSSPNTTSGNGVCNKNIVDAILPRYFNGVLVYGTGYYSISQLLYLKTVFIPSTYRHISEDTFHGDSALETVTFEDQRSIIYFGFWLFRNANISTITIPYKAKHISIITSFYGCKNLKSVYYQGMLNITSNENTFAGVPADLKIFVRYDYPYATLGGRTVTKVLPRPQNRKTLSCKRKTSNITMLVIITLAYHQT